MFRLDKRPFLEDNFIFRSSREEAWHSEFQEGSLDHAAAKVGGASVSLKNPRKVGIGTWEIDSHGSAFSDLDTFDFGWYTNWRPDPLFIPQGKGHAAQGLADARFVPMIWGKADLTAANIKP
ncbi:hypothetical protein [Shinella sp. HZN7]|uniref:hypothetical protein n=1 Tax=Shinella sp. (strain HZN7) TaxID=879274 RepID=UPI0007DA5FC7|nr:hypothetical protein [Shinella sp. HZN7]ANH09141.1 hypothetical protein shn_34035 [Shinella sp. HZN7]